MVHLHFGDVVGELTLAYGLKHVTVSPSQMERGSTNIVHSEQGSADDRAEFVQLIQTIAAQRSMGANGAPWQHGDKESLYGHFTAEARDLDRFDTLGELVDFVNQQIVYDNHHRILRSRCPQKRSGRDTVSEKSGT